MKITFLKLKKVFCLTLILGQLFLAGSCSNIFNKNTEDATSIQSLGKSYFTYFDTVSYVYSYAGDTKDEFLANCDIVSDILNEYNQLFDIYHEYTGVNNLCTINKYAGQDPIQVDKKLIDFLVYTKELYTLTKGEMNVMLGSVLKLWHDARTTSLEDSSKAYIPTESELYQASKYTSIDLLEIDEENCTVRIADAHASIDVGGVGKGYATEVAGEALREKGITSYVLNIGGNIKIVGTKVDGTGWNTGIKDPLDTSQYTMKINIKDTSCVTSGTYERYFVYNGQKYHHIIDKDTLQPANYFVSVTILCSNSGLADALSTALFCMSYEEGLTLVESLDTKVDVLWITPDGTKYKTSGIIPIEN